MKLKSVNIHKNNYLYLSNQFSLPFFIKIFYSKKVIISSSDFTLNNKIEIDWFHVKHPIDDIFFYSNLENRYILKLNLYSQFNQVFIHEISYKHYHVFIILLHLNSSLYIKEFN